MNWLPLRAELEYSPRQVCCNNSRAPIPNFAAVHQDRVHPERAVRPFSLDMSVMPGTVPSSRVSRGDAPLGRHVVGQLLHLGTADGRQHVGQPVVVADLVVNVFQRVVLGLRGQILGLAAQASLSVTIIPPPPVVMILLPLKLKQAMSPRLPTFGPCTWRPGSRWRLRSRQDRTCAPTPGSGPCRRDGREYGRAGWPTRGARGRLRNSPPSHAHCCSRKSATRCGSICQ